MISGAFNPEGGAGLVRKSNDSAWEIGRDWGSVARDLPQQIADYFQARIRKNGFRVSALELAETRLRIDRRRNSRARVQLMWARAWTPRSRDRTRDVVRVAVDDTKKFDHWGRVVHPRYVSQLPTTLRETTVEDGVLVVSDPQRTRGALFLRSFLEVTPPEVVIHAAKTLASVRGQAEGLPASLRAWDITAGSATVLTVIRALGGEVVSSDLTNPAAPVIMNDARRLDDLPRYRGKRAKALSPSLSKLEHGEMAVDRPDIVFFDPPSRGTPTHATVYGHGDRNDLDLAVLDRDEWLGEIVAIAIRASLHLAPDGLVSLVVRAGCRDSRRLTPDNELVADVKYLATEHRLQVIGEARISYDRACAQASAARHRLPMTHLLVQRAS